MTKTDKTTKRGRPARTICGINNTADNIAIITMADLKTNQDVIDLKKRLNKMTKNSNIK